MGMPAACLGDIQYCPAQTINVFPHIGGPILGIRQAFVHINGRLAARRTDLAVCTGYCAPANAVTVGAWSVLIAGMPAARMLDKMAHGGIILSGFPLVLIGDTPAASGAGKPYPSAEAAARAAIDEINRKSIEEGKEYCGNVYQNPDGKTYSYTPPTEGTADRCKPKAPVPTGCNTCGDYHTHGDYGCKHEGNHEQTSDPSRDTYNSDNFSGADKEGINKAARKNPDSNYKGYVGTPSGGKQEYDPITGTTRPF